MLAVAWSSDGTLLATSVLGEIGAALNNAIYLRDACSGKLRRILVGHTSLVEALAWAPHNRRLASASSDNTVILWNIASTADITLKGHTTSVHCVAWCPNGPMVASGSDDCTVRVWDTDVGQCLQVLEGHTCRVQSVSWAFDGRRLATGGVDHYIKVWDTTTGECFLSVKGHRGCVASVAWCPRGNVIASASDDGTVRLWDAMGATVEHSLVGRARHYLVGRARHYDMFTAVAWCADGMRLASASNDCTTALWNGTTLARIGTLAGHSRGVEKVAWSPDGTRLATAGNDGRLMVWLV